MDSKEKLILKKFKHFLAQNNVLHQYRINIYNNKKKLNKIGEWENYLQPLRKLHIGEELIRSAFVWSCTPQGHKFWETLDKKWRQNIT